MVVGERFEKDGKLYEVTGVFQGGYATKEVEKEVLPEFTMPVEEETPKKRRTRKAK